MGPLSAALETALAAARDAAEILRAEFYRPGGPRGPDGHCPADEAAEDAIRARLEGRFPTFGVVGEERPERDRPPQDPGGHAWVIDPNDGTSDFQRGYRGAAVSIALLREGEPVLGVVLAHTAPHGGEDLFAWAEGEGPVLRNGVALPPLPDAGLGKGDVVLVSGESVRSIEAWLRALAPARPRPQASIAYRLALAAAGEARLALSVHHPRALDVAGGHALLRGAGGALLDGAGEEVRYPRDGHARLEACFGGPRRAAAALAGRAFPRRGGGAYPLARPVPGGAIADAGRLARAQGALLGQLAGDALGSLVEFAAPHEIARDHPAGVRELVDGGTWNTIAGQPTDDSELALSLARALLDGGFDAGRVACAYADWHLGGPFDEGGTTRAALGPAGRVREAGRPGAEVAAAARAAALPESLANGALMRIAPVGIAAAGAPGRARAWARADAALTHPNPVCAAASAVFASAIAHAIETGEGAREVAAFAEALAAAEGAPPEVLAALAAAHRAPPDTMTHQGLVTVALQNAFFQLRHAGSLEEGLVATVGLGGDTDTNGAIAGALLGAVHGVHAVPLRWRGAVLSCFPVAGAPGVGNPRPPALWPADALVLAERLAAGGWRAVGAHVRAP